MPGAFDAPLGRVAVALAVVQDPDGFAGWGLEVSLDAHKALMGHGGRLASRHGGYLVATPPGSLQAVFTRPAAAVMWLLHLQDELGCQHVPESEGRGRQQQEKRPRGEQGQQHAATVSQVAPGTLGITAADGSVATAVAWSGAGAELCARAAPVTARAGTTAAAPAVLPGGSRHETMTALSASVAICSDSGGNGGGGAGGGGVLVSGSNLLPMGSSQILSIAETRDAGRMLQRAAAAAQLSLFRVKGGVDVGSATAALRDGGAMSYSGGAVKRASCLAANAAWREVLVSVEVVRAVAGEGHPALRARRSVKQRQRQGGRLLPPGTTAANLLHPAAAASTTTGTVSDPRRNGLELTNFSRRSISDPQVAGCCEETSTSQQAGSCNPRQYPIHPQAGIAAAESPQPLQQHNPSLSLQRPCVHHRRRQQRQHQQEQILQPFLSLPSAALEAPYVEWRLQIAAERQESQAEGQVAAAGDPGVSVGAGSAAPTGAAMNGAAGATDASMARHVGVRKEVPSLRTRAPAELDDGEGGAVASASVCASAATLPPTESCEHSALGTFNEDAAPRLPSQQQLTQQQQDLPFGTFCPQQQQQRQHQRPWPLSQPQCTVAAMSLSHTQPALPQPSTEPDLQPQPPPGEPAGSGRGLWFFPEVREVRYKGGTIAACVARLVDTE